MRKETRRLLAKLLIILLVAFMCVQLISSLLYINA